MKKILILLGNYLPNPSANGVCISNVVDELIKEDYDVSCIVYDENYSELYENINETHIFRIKRDLIERLIISIRKGKNERLVILQRILEFFRKIKQVLLIPLYPWTDITYTIKLYFKAKKLISNEFFDAIICVHVPIDTLIVGHFIKNKFKNIKYITYFLDSLSGGFNLKILPKKWSINRKHNWEKVLLSNSDLNIMMQSSYNHIMKHRRNDKYLTNTIFLDIPLLVRKNILSKGDSILNLKKINIVYTGTLYSSSRNPNYILDLFTRIKREDVALTFIGNSDCEKIFKLKNTFFQGDINYFPHLEHNRILEVLNDADIFLNIGVDNKNAISGKIFEYMSFGKPIISTYSIDDESCIPYLNRYDLSLLIDQRESLDINTSKISNFIDRNINSKVSFNSIENQFYTNTPKAFVDSIENILRMNLNND